MSAPADLLDQASELTDTLTAAYISNVQDSAAPQQKRNADGTWPHPNCVECEDPQPPERLALGRIYCVSCQQDREALAKRGPQ